MATIDEVRVLLRNALQLGTLAASYTAETRLLGSLPEFDSVSVVTVITAIEQRYGFTVDDDEINADVFETVGSLVAFIQRKLDARQN